MNNLENRNSMQKRVLIATLVAFIFFVAYDYFFMKPKREAVALNSQVSKEVNTTKDTPSVVVNQVSGNGQENIQAPTPASLSKEEIVATIKTNTSVVEIDRLGRIAQITLTEEQYVVENGDHIKLFHPDQLKPLEVRFSDRTTNDEAFKTNVIASVNELDVTSGAKDITLTQTLPDTVLTKKLTFYPDGHYDIEVSSTNNKQFFITQGFRPEVLVDMYADHGALLKLNDNTLTIVEDEDLDKTQNFTGVKISSNFDRYYATVLYNLDTSFQVTLMPDTNKNPQAFIHVNDTFKASGYIGPKAYDVLHELNPELTDVIEYGWFTFIAKPMFIFLKSIHEVVGNWGWTIVILTIIIKLILFPLSYKGMVSMQKLKELAPKIKDIQIKYKDDKQKQSMHMMELYKKHGANPMGGCLPIILQIPVFFAIYRVLLNAIELKGAPWILWIHDLALMDPYYVLPILMGATMYLQQKITPNTIQDEMQKKVFQFLPVIFTFFFLWFPAGLTLYWFVNNLFTVAQQYYINQVFEKKKATKK